MSPRFELRIERECYAPGDRIRGTIRVLEGGGSRSLEVQLNYIERTEDFATVATSISSGPLHAGALTTGMSFEFELRLPSDALPNCRGERGELYWEVDLKSETFGPDTHQRRRIEIAPAQRPPR